MKKNSTKAPQLEPAVEITPSGSPTSNADASITHPPISKTFDDIQRKNLQHTSLMGAITRAVGRETIRIMTDDRQMGIAHTSFNRKAMLRAIEDEILGLIDAEIATLILYSKLSPKKQLQKVNSKSVAGLKIEAKSESTASTRSSIDAQKSGVFYHPGNRTLH